MYIFKHCNIKYRYTDFTFNKIKKEFHFLYNSCVH